MSDESGYCRLILHRSSFILGLDRLLWLQRALPSATLDKIPKPSCYEDSKPACNKGQRQFADFAEKGGRKVDKMNECGQC